MVQIGTVERINRGSIISYTGQHGCTGPVLDKMQCVVNYILSIFKGLKVMLVDKTYQDQ